MDYKIELETGKIQVIRNPAKLKLKRGRDSWTYIYVWLAIVIGCESTIISVSPIEINFASKIALLLVIWGVTGWLFLRDDWFKNKLIELKIKIEDHEDIS